MALLSLIRAIIVCGQQNIALRGHVDSGVILNADNNNNDGNFRSILRLMIMCGDDRLKKHLETAPKNARYVSPIIQNEIINVIGEFIQQRLVKDIKEGGGLYSILADETQDTATVEQMSLCIRYYKNGSICEDFMLFQDLFRESFEIDFSALEDGEVIEPKLTGKVIGQAILKNLHNLGLDIQNCVGQGYDGAATMSSNIVGASAIILEKNPRALYTHCVSHSLNLAVVDASKLQEIRNMIGTIRQVVSFINMSAKRKTVFSAAVKYKLPDHPTTHLKSLCETRWVERHEAIETFLVLLPSIKLTLSQVILIVLLVA